MQVVFTNIHHITLHDITMYQTDKAGCPQQHKANYILVNCGPNLCTSQTFKTTLLWWKLLPQARIELESNSGWFHFINGIIYTCAWGLLTWQSTCASFAPHCPNTLGYVLQSFLRAPMWFCVTTPACTDCMIQCHSIVFQWQVPDQNSSRHDVWDMKFPQWSNLCTHTCGNVIE